MPKFCSQAHISVCSFTFADVRRCRTPRCVDHPHLCYFHAKREAQAAASGKIGSEIAHGLPVKSRHSRPVQLLIHSSG